KSGRVVVAGRDVTHERAKVTLDAGLGHIPEDRHRRGLVLPFSLSENLALHAYRKPPMSIRGFLNLRAMLARAKRLLAEFDVRGGSPSTAAGALSGGNQQKVVLAREIDGNPKVLIAAQPTRGLDVGAIEFVHRRLVEQRDAGRAVFLVSLELEEILSLSDRILVIYEGRIVGEFPPTPTADGLGLAMAGGRRGGVAAAGAWARRSASRSGGTGFAGAGAGHDGRASGRRSDRGPTAGDAAAVAELPVAVRRVEGRNRAGDHRRDRL